MQDFFFRQWKHHVYLSSTVRIGSEIHPLHPPSLFNTVHWDHRLLLSFTSTEVITRAAEKGDSAEGQQRKEILMGNRKRRFCWRAAEKRRFWWTAAEKGDSDEGQQRKEILLKGSIERRFLLKGSREIRFLMKGSRERRFLLKGSIERRFWWRAEEKGDSEWRHHLCWGEA